MKIQHLSLLVIFVSLILGGCQGFTTHVKKPFTKVPEAPVVHPVSEMICLWEHAEGIGMDKKPTRGFAGQLMFFAIKNSAPVPMDGEIEIYVFDDFGTPEEQSKPLHTFKFDRDSFAAFRTDTNLGMAYQVFIPYVRKTEYKASCSLRVKLTPESGQPLYSKMASVTLPGPESPQAIARMKREKQAIQQANYEAIEPTRPPQAASPEETSAYFGAATLPKTNVDLNDDRARLRSTLSQIVQHPEAPSAVTVPQSHPLHAESKSSNHLHSVQQTRQPMGQHPLQGGTESAFNQQLQPPRMNAHNPDRHPLLDD